jgi:hypothetical protein
MATNLSEKLLSEVNDFLRETEMGPSYFGKAASGNSELVKRLREGKRVWPETADKVRIFMREHRRKVSAA